MLETLVDYNKSNNATFSSENILKAISKGIEEVLEDERNITLDTHNITMDTFCQFPRHNQYTSRECKRNLNKWENK